LGGQVICIWQKAGCGLFETRATRPGAVEESLGKGAVAGGDVALRLLIHIQVTEAGATEVLQDDAWRSGRFGRSMTMIAVGTGGFFF
jgi:hypothetical protein